MSLVTMMHAQFNGGRVGWARRAFMISSAFRVATALLVVVLSACGAKSSEQSSKETKMTYPPPLKPGQVLDPESLYAKRWRDRPTPIRLNEELGFAVPPGYQPFWFDEKKGLVDTPKTWKEIPVGSLTFRFFMPDFRGYTPDNYLRVFDEDRVDVISIQWAGLG
jgi:hypothetical protein